MSVRTIQDLVPSHSVVLAPMAGVTEAPFRAICKRMGAALTYTEMVSAKGLHYNPHSSGSSALLAIDPGEAPAAVQLFGADPGLMAEQAVRLVERLGNDLALIDVNMGCPVAKVVNKGEGSALMRTPEVAAAIVSALVAAVDVPVTVKFRAGWDTQSVNAVDFARRMEAAGAHAVAVHGRTREQFYRGSSDAAVVAAVKRAVSIPVYGSGDVFCAQDVVEMFRHTGVDAVMVARGAQGNPWIFREARALIDTGRAVDPPSPAERVLMAKLHAQMLREFGGERSVRRMRKHVAWYVHGLKGATFVRTKVNETLTYDELDALLDEYLSFLERP